MGFNRARTDCLQNILAIRHTQKKTGHGMNIINARSFSLYIFISISQRMFIFLSLCVFTHQPLYLFFVAAPFGNFPSWSRRPWINLWLWVFLACISGNPTEQDMSILGYTSLHQTKSQITVRLAFLYSMVNIVTHQQSPDDAMYYRGKTECAPEHTSWPTHISFISIIDPIKHMNLLKIEF